LLRDIMRRIEDLAVVASRMNTPDAPVFGARIRTHHRGGGGRD
jgi:hypothetical protein